MKKQKLVKYQKFSKYYVRHCLQNLILLFMSLLAPLIVESRDRLAGNYFVLLKKRRWPNVKVFLNKFDVSRKNGKVLILILRWNCIKGLIVIKFVKNVNLEVAWTELKAKNCLQGQPWTKFLKKTLVFMWNSALWTIFNFYFSAVF